MTLDPDDPLLAVVAPPRVAHFRERAGLRDDEGVTADFSGWSKLVLLTDHLAILFPRDHTQAEAVESELRALRALQSLGMAEIPRLVDVWDDPSVSPHRVVVLGRLPGRLLDHEIETMDSEALTSVLEQVARLAAGWHRAEPGSLLDRPPRTSAAHVEVDQLLSADPTAPTVEDLADGAADRLGLARSDCRRTAEALTVARRLPAVLVHGDLHEGQILVDEQLRVTGILDWQTARVGHPFSEFDLGEWGTAAWRSHRRSFPALRERLWTTYASTRGLDEDFGPAFELFWALVHALRWPQSVYVGSEVTGSFEECMEVLHQALR